MFLSESACPCQDRQLRWVAGAGHLVEALMSKVAAQLGKEGDATPFIDLSYQKISDMLHQCGYQQRGWETMYNGHTGRQLKVPPALPCACRIGNQFNDRAGMIKRV